MKENKNKHMTLQDRIEIQEGLYKGKTFKEIGEEEQKNNKNTKK